MKPVMDSFFPGSLSTDEKKVIIEELLQGHQLSTQLKGLFQKRTGFDGSPSAAEDLVMKIHRSLTHSISLLTSGKSDGEGSVSLDISGHDNNSLPAASLDDLRSEDSGENRKRSTKEKRGCYRRRKNGQTLTIFKPNPQDNYAWRKYGQKEILNSKHPRSYFRCTHKFDQGCKAVKQVQRMEENPEKYHITYIGDHTCTQVSKTPQMIRGSGPCESVFVNGNGWEIDQTKHDDYSQQLLSSSSIPNTQRGHFKQETDTSMIGFTDNLSSLDTCSLWPNSNYDELSATAAAILSPQVKSDDNGDTVHSYTDTGSQSFGKDFVVDSVHFGDSTDFSFYDSWVANE